MQSFRFRNISLYCSLFFNYDYHLNLCSLLEPIFQRFPSSLELLLVDSWSESETLNFSNTRNSSVLFPFFIVSIFFNLFSTITLTSCLVYFFSFLKFLLVFYFACLINALRVVHLSVVRPHILRTCNVSLFLPHLRTSFSEPLKIIAFLFNLLEL